MEKPADKKPFVAVNSSPAMSGHFATLYDWSWLEGGVNIHGEPYEGRWFAEPYDTGMGRYTDWRDANKEGAEWAECEGLEFHPATEESVARAKLSSEALHKRLRRVQDLQKSGLPSKEAYRQAREEFPFPDEQ